MLTPGGYLQVKTYAVNNSSGHTFYVMAADGSAPDREKVKQACSDIGGKLVDPGARAMNLLPDLVASEYLADTEDTG